MARANHRHRRNEEEDAGGLVAGSPERLPTMALDGMVRGQGIKARGNSGLKESMIKIIDYSGSPSMALKIIAEQWLRSWRSWSTRVKVRIK